MFTENKKGGPIIRANKAPSSDLHNYRNCAAIYNEPAVSWFNKLTGSNKCLEVTKVCSSFYFTNF
jgi:hypothetical protein